MSAANTPRIALITGGSRGLGRNAAVHLARQGTDVILTYKGNEAEAQAAMAKSRPLAAVPWPCSWTWATAAASRPSPNA